MQVLIVDDDQDLREVYQEVIERDGHEPIIARSGDEALVLLETVSPDVILTDLLMPDGNGMKVVEAAHARDIPVVIVSGYVGAYAGVLPPNARMVEKGGDELESLGKVLADMVMMRRLA
jgi:DNA-binding NtrC family response regulator